MTADDQAARTLKLLALACALSFASTGLQMPFTSVAMQHAGSSLDVVGLMWSIRSAVAFFAVPVWGYWADRRGDARPFVIAACFSAAVLLGLVAVFPSAWMGVAAFAAFGAVSSATSSLMDGMFLTVLGKQRERFGRWRLFGTVGFGVTALGMSLAVDAGWARTTPAVVFGVAALFSLLAGAVLLRVERVPRPRLQATASMSAAVRHPALLPLYLTGGVLWASHMGYTTLVAPAAAAMGLSEWVVGASLAAAVTVEVIALRWSELLLVRFGARRLLVAAGVTATVRFGLLALCTSPLAFIALHALHGVTFGVLFAALVSLVSERAPPELRQAAQGALASTSFALGSAVGSLIAGPLLERHGPVWMWAVMSAIALLGTLVARRTTHAQPQT